MNSILLISIVVRLVAMGWSIVLLRRLREWRMGFLTVMLLLMACRQVLTLLGSGNSKATFSAATEVPGLLVSFMALAAVHALQRVFEDRRAAEERRRELEAQLQHAQRLESLGMLAGGIAHDFNNLLTPVLIHSSILKDALRDDETSADRAASIETAATHAAELCNQMLVFSGRGRFKLEAVDLSKLVESIGRLLDVGIPASVVVTHDLARDLPPIHADARQLQQVIMNLITNAVDSMAGIGGQLMIRTGVIHSATVGLMGCSFDNLSDGEYVFLEVTDTGCGMDTETLRHMFDPFFTTKQRGSGLGMASVLGIVRGHHGAICVCSQPGQGTTIRLLLPPAAGDLVVELPEDADVSFRGSGLALVADDDLAVRQAAGSVLEAAGFRVLLAEDGREALKIVDANGGSLQLMLLDLSMPRLSGNEVLSRVTQLGLQVPVILSSGFDADHIAGLANRDDGPEFLHKPYRASDLLEAARTVLNRQATQQERTPSGLRDRPIPPQGRSVLVVDDEPGVRQSLCDLIDVLGYDTLEARAGEDALALCEQRAGEIGLVLLDQRMPGLSGEETLQRLTELHSHLPVVLCHGGGHEGLSSEARDRVAGILTKPFQIDRLESLLTTLLPDTRVES